MDLNFVPELLSLAPLSAALYLMWKEHKRLRSLTPFILAIVLFIVARLCDVLIQAPSAFPSAMLGLAKGAINPLLNGLSDLSDTLGVFLIVAGFVQTIRFEREEKKRIDALEAVLPICSWCKKYRTDNGDWQPIEQYLKENGRALTHGICPDCAERYFTARA